MTKISALASVASVAGTDEFGVNKAGVSDKATAQQIRTYIGSGLTNAAVAGVGGAYAADTYLAGSSIAIPTAGAWSLQSIYHCLFEISKTAAGVAAFTITVRMGTLTTTADAAIITIPFGIGTAAVDAGHFDVYCSFRSVGAGVAAVLTSSVCCSHNLAGTGLTTTGTGGTAVIATTSAGFDSTSQTVIGLSINGGAAFSGTTQLVVAELSKYQ